MIVKEWGPRENDAECCANTISSGNVCVYVRVQGAVDWA